MTETMNPFWFYLPFMIIIAFFGYIIPMLSRKNIIFGVKFPHSMQDSEDVLQIKKHFKISFPIFMIFFIIFSGIFLANTRDLNLGGLLIIIQALIMFIFYAYFNKKMKAIKSDPSKMPPRTEAVVTVDTSFRNKNLTISSLWYILPLVIVLLNFGIVALNYHSIPQKIPMNYDFSGEVTNYASKTFFTSFLMPLLSLFFLVIFFFINLIIKYAKQNIDTAQPKKSSVQNRIFRYKWSKFTFLSGTALILSLFLSSLSQLEIYPLPPYYVFFFVMFIIFIIVFSAIYLSLKLGQSGAKIRVNIEEEEEQKAEDYDDDKYWKSGIFYYNPDDPAIFVEKRIGVGWTMNFANPVAIIISIGLIAIIVISIVMGIT